MTSFDRSQKAYQDYQRRMHGAYPDLPKPWPIMSIIWRAAVIITAMAAIGRYWP